PPGGAGTGPTTPAPSACGNARGGGPTPAGNAGTVCRPAVGFCDAAESCTGQSPTCPPDVAATSGKPCRPAAGDCDLADVCDGTSKSCPADAKKTGVCRPSPRAREVRGRVGGAGAH